MAEKIDKAAFTRADLVEIVGAQLPVDTERSPREVIEAAVDEIGDAAQRDRAPRISARAMSGSPWIASWPRRRRVLDLVDAADPRSMLWVKTTTPRACRRIRERAVETIGGSPWLVCPLSAPAGAGKTTSLRALAKAAQHRSRATSLVLAPTGKAVDVAVREGAGDSGYTVAKALHMLRDNTLPLTAGPWSSSTRPGMVGTDDLRQLLTATTAAGAKTVLVGDAHQLAPVKARGGMFAQLCADLPWTQQLSEVWRLRDPEERSASLALRDGGPAPVRRAIGWYRSHDRLHSGDPIAMAA